MWIPETSSRYYGVSRLFLLDFIRYEISPNSTLFWAGDTFAPKLKIKTKSGQELPVQQYLQGAFFDMFDVVAKKLGNLDGVLGFEVRCFVVCLVMFS